MTKNSIAIAPAFLVLACAVALAACGKSEGGHPGEAAKSSSAGLPDGDLEAGKKLASTKNAATGQACVDCHGADGNQPIDPTYPKLGGQYTSYIEHALQAYRKGDRENALMAGQAKALTDQQIADLGSYFGSAPSQLRDLSGTHD